jgi:vacuolar-type H+-ATPase subunit H
MTRVGVYIMMGRVAADDAEAVRAINSEVEGLLANMVEGARALDPAAIREAANKARQLSAMLTDEASGKVRDAIDTARRVARDIVKSAERAEVVVDELALAKIGNTRLAFLDMDGPEVSSVEAKPQARALELMASLEAAGIEGGAASARALELDLGGEVTPITIDRASVQRMIDWEG